MNRPPLLEAAIRPIVETFYERVRADPGIGPVFAEAVADWDDHHARLTDFWSSVMLGTGRYKGNPVALHLRHAAKLSPQAFERWLQLWARTTDDMLPPGTARVMQTKAERIAESLQFAIGHRNPATI